MVGYMQDPPEVEASCAICGAPPYPECPHESQRLELALNQAAQKWAEMQTVREWVLQHARNQILFTFNHLKTARREAHQAFLQTLPCYTLYQKYHGNPPLQPIQLHMLQHRINEANAVYRAGIDEDWRRSCLRYPEVLDYYFSLIEISFPSDGDSSVREPRFGAPLNGTRRLKARRGSRGSLGSSNGHRKKGRRRNSRGRTPPPAPMPGAYR